MHTSVPRSSRPMRPKYLGAIKDKFLFVAVCIFPINFFVTKLLECLHQGATVVVRSTKSLLAETVSFIYHVCCVRECIPIFGTRIDLLLSRVLATDSKIHFQQHAQILPAKLSWGGLFCCCSLPGVSRAIFARSPQSLWVRAARSPGELEPCAPADTQSSENFL